MDLMQLGMFAFLYHPYLLSFITGMLGEEFVLLLAVFSGRGVIPLWTVMLVCLMGMITLEHVWFFVGKTKRVTKFSKWMTSRKSYVKLANLAQALNGKNRFRAFFLSKFVYGLRVIQIVNASANGMKYRDFWKYNLTAVALWVAIFVPIGWFAGRGFDLIFNVFHGVEKVITFAVGIVVIYFIFEYGLRRYLIKKLLG